MPKIDDELIPEDEHIDIADIPGITVTAPRDESYSQQPTWLRLSTKYWQEQILEAFSGRGSQFEEPSTPAPVVEELIVTAEAAGVTYIDPGVLRGIRSPVTAQQALYGLISAVFYEELLAILKFGPWSFDPYQNLDKPAEEPVGPDDAFPDAANDPYYDPAEVRPFRPKQDGGKPVPPVPGGDDVLMDVANELVNGEGSWVNTEGILERDPDSLPESEWQGAQAAELGLGMAADVSLNSDDLGAHIYPRKDEQWTVGWEEDPHTLEEPGWEYVELPQSEDRYQRRSPWVRVNDENAPYGLSDVGFEGPALRQLRDFMSRQTEGISREQQLRFDTRIGIGPGTRVNVNFGYRTALSYDFAERIYRRDEGKRESQAGYLAMVAMINKYYGRLSEVWDSLSVVLDNITVGGKKLSDYPRRERFEVLYKNWRNLEFDTEGIVLGLIQETMTDLAIGIMSQAEAKFMLDRFGPDSIFNKLYGLPSTVVRRMIKAQERALEQHLPPGIDVNPSPWGNIKREVVNWRRERGI